MTVAGLLPLLKEGVSSDATFAWRDGRSISRATFAHDVARLAQVLPDRGHVLNVCVDRYRFAVGLAAAAIRAQVSLLPPSTHAETIRHLQTHFGDVYCLAETVQEAIDLPQVLFDEVLATSPTQAATMALAIPADRTVACVFTSGSTGVPTAHRKRWGSLVINVRSEIDRLAMDSPDDADQPWAIVATVPPQHMFGFESSVLMAWLSGAALVGERPFFPADIAASLDRIPARRLLVTTPFHLRTLLAEGSALPRIDRILCATAPLSLELAREAEARCNAPVAEIYGCTETGQLASRRPTDDLRWQLLGDITLAEEGGRTIASGGHVEQPTPLADVIELAPDFASSRRFALAGRTGDLVNIAGKRTSLGYLNVQLQAIDGVIDGTFYLPEDADAREARGGVARLAAVVVAPTLDARRVLDALRARIDAVFLPRPIHFVDRLPRNTTGKLTRAMLDALLAQQARSAPGGDDRPPA